MAEPLTAKTQTQAHILVVDDDQRLRDLLTRYLSEQGYHVTAADSAAAARERLRSIRFDLAVLDIMMPGEDGLALTRALRRHSTMPILLLTAMSESGERISGLEAGADDYLAKPFEPRELVLRINAILRRASEGPLEVPGQAITFGPFSFDLKREELTCEGAYIYLTEAEATLLGALAENPGVAVSRDALCDQGQAMSSARAVDVQMTRLRRKIEEDPRYPRYLQTVRGTGYALIAD